jgi:hypothetical protein
MARVVEINKARVPAVEDKFSCSVLNFIATSLRQLEGHEVIKIRL